VSTDLIAATLNINWVRDLILKLDRGLCHICKRKVAIKDAVLDHIIPKSSYGLYGILTSDEYWNLRLAHKGCNSKRCNGRLPGQLRLPLPLDDLK